MKLFQTIKEPKSPSLSSPRNDIRHDIITLCPIPKFTAPKSKTFTPNYSYAQPPHDSQTNILLNSIYPPNNPCALTPTLPRPEFFFLKGNTQLRLKKLPFTPR
ncbi:MAG: hypothetical protein GX799_07905 [Crenarchaeota archaeon]|nr:hypothetical protein [Thermoproteota archaeon]